MTTVGFIGTGHIAAPMARFLAARGHEVVVSERNAGIAADLATDPAITVAPNQGVLDRADTVFLCLRPHLAPDILPDLRFRADHRVISVMAGVSHTQLAALCSPATQFTQTIPLGFLEKGGCPLPAFPDADPLASLFAPENPVFAVPSEEALNLHFAICALMPGIFDLLATGADWLGDQTGDPDKAAFYTQQLLAGFLASLPPGSGGRFAAERDALATGGTLSLQMVEALRDGGAGQAVLEGLEAIRGRLGGGG